jgi:antitoxin MazE
LRIPKGVAQQARVEPGTVVEVTVEGGEITVRPVARKRYALADLLDGVTTKNVHAAVDTGAVVGRESW